MIYRDSPKLVIVPPFSAGINGDIVAVLPDAIGQGEAWVDSGQVGVSDGNGIKWHVTVILYRELVIDIIAGLHGKI